MNNKLLTDKKYFLFHLSKNILFKQPTSQKNILRLLTLRWRSFLETQSEPIIKRKQTEVDGLRD